MTAPSKGISKHTAALGLLALLMSSHLAFLGFGAKHCHDLVISEPAKITEQCNRSTEIFQEAAQMYIAIILALMAPLPK